MMTQTETDWLDKMVEPVENQQLIDKLSALALLGKVDWYAAKQGTEDGDWERMRELIEEADNA